jgi:hypothetical protein
MSREGRWLSDDWANDLSCYDLILIWIGYITYFSFRYILGIQDIPRRFGVIEKLYTVFAAELTTV